MSTRPPRAGRTGRTMAGALGATMLLTALSACGSPGDTEDLAPASAVPADADLARVRSSFSPCPDSQRGEGVDALGFLASASQWVDVLSVVSADRDGAGDNAFAEATVRTPDGERTLFVHRSFWPGMDWALAHGGTVQVALPKPGDYTRDDTVMVAVATTPSGKVFFPGNCQEKSFRGPLASKFGDGLDTQLRGLSHRPVVALRRQLTAKPSAEEAPDSTRILNPQDAPAALLASLQIVAVHITVDEATGTNTTVCTRIAKGWNDCVVPDAATASSGLTVNAYLDASRRLEVWLLNADADVSKPIKKLGVIDFGRANANARSLAANIHVQLKGQAKVTLRDQFSSEKRPQRWEKDARGQLAVGSDARSAAAVNP